MSQTNVPSLSETVVKQRVDRAKRAEKRNVLRYVSGPQGNVSTYTCNRFNLKNNRPTASPHLQSHHAETMDAPAQVPPAAQGPPTVTPPLLPQTAAAAQANPIVAAAQLRQPFPNVQIPTFSNLPTEKVQNYLEDLEMTQRLLQWSAEELFQAVQFCLRGDAKVWLRHVPAGHKCDYPSLKAAMLDRFHTPTPDWRRIFTLSEVRQQDNEHPKEYAQRILNHVGNAHVSDSLLTGAFVQGLQSAVKTDVAKANPPSFSEAVSIASRMYAINKSYGTNSSDTNSVLQAQMTMLQSQMSAMLNMCQSKYDHPPPPPDCNPCTGFPKRLLISHPYRSRHVHRITATQVSSPTA